jgi:D-alanyl-D-alanine carboxypeptidase
MRTRSLPARPSTIPLGAAVAVTVALLAGCATGGSSPPAAAPAPVVAAVEVARSALGAPGALLASSGAATQTWSAVMGTTELGGAVPVDVAMRWRSGSITKVVVATVVVELVSEGRLGLDDPVSRWVPGLLAADRPDVTVRQLLDHTSGLFDETNDVDRTAVADEPARLADPALRAQAEAVVRGIGAPGGPIASARLLVALAETHPRAFPPGSSWHYSNVNYQLLGLVVEAVTGRPLAAEVRARVLDPLGLRGSGLAPTEAIAPELRGYELDARPGRDSTDELSLFGNGASGELVTTAADLTAFMHALLGGRLVAEPWLTQMLTPSPASAARGDDYGLGVATYHLTCGTFYGHGGSVNGTESIALGDRHGRHVVLAAINGRRASGGTDWRGLADRLACG